MARDGNCVVFVEVKTRTVPCGGTGPRGGQPFEAVTPQKMRKIARLATMYLRHYRLETLPSRFDVISILCEDDAKPKIDHYQHAFNADGK